MAHVAEQGHREHGRRVVEPRLALQHAGQPGRQRQLAQHREHRGGIGRREHRAEQQRVPPAQVQQQAGRRRDHHDTHHHPHSGQAQRHGSRGAGMSPVGRQAALGQDQHQRAETQRLRQPGIIEPDARACLAQSQAQAQEHQQARQADPVRRPGRGDRHEHHDGADQQDETKVACRHGRLRSPCRRSGQGQQDPQMRNLASLYPHVPAQRGRPGWRAARCRTAPGCLPSAHLGRRDA